MDVFDENLDSILRRLIVKLHHDPMVTDLNYSFLFKLKFSHTQLLYNDDTEPKKKTHSTYKNLQSHKMNIRRGKWQKKKKDKM